MKKRVLIIGGSMFVGRVFTILASRSGDFELHVVNRGRFPLGELENVTSYKCDRHSVPVLARAVPDVHYDAVIDFCAYNSGEVAPILTALAPRIGQYICFSTSSVYDPTYRGVKTEDFPLRLVEPQTGLEEEYVGGKILVENELIAAASKNNVPYTILRPTFIYGPFNYAPREPWFIEMIARKLTVPVPIDATSSFSFVFVKDIARVLMKMVGDERAYNETFNLAAQEKVTYARLISDFERYNGGSFDSREVTVVEAERENIELPFPLRDDDLVSGEKLSKAFDFEYTPLAEGMEETFKLFYGLYTS